MSKKTKLLLLVSGLFALAIGLSNVFVNVFLWKKSNDFVLIANYNLMHYIFAPIAFLIAGWISKRKNGIWSLRVGIVLFAIFFSLILLLQDQVQDYIYAFGILFGFAAGFYWLAFNVLSFDFTSTNNRDTFNGFYGSIIGVANALAPFSASFIIRQNNNSIGYTIVFALSLSLFIILILVSFLLRSEHYGEHLTFKKIYHSDKLKWKTIRKALIFWGFRDVIILFIISVLIFDTTGSEFALGILTLIAYLLSSIAHIAEQKFIKPKRRWISFHVGAIFLLISVLGLIFDINFYFLLIFIIIDAISMPFFLIPMTSATYNLIDKSKEKNLRTEYIINRELALNTGRIISISILISLLSFFNRERVLNYYLLLLGFTPLFSLYFLRKLDIWSQ